MVFPRMYFLSRIALYVLQMHSQSDSFSNKFLNVHVCEVFLSSLASSVPLSIQIFCGQFFFVIMVEVGVRVSLIIFVLIPLESTALNMF